MQAIRDDRGVDDVSGIAARVHAALAEAFGIEESILTSDASLYADVGADSLAVMETICALEDDLGIELPESNEFALGIRTVGDLVAAFEAHAT
jgi:acyl carrier protein